MTGFHYAGMVLVATVLLVLAGCSIGPKYQPPIAPTPAVYKESPGQFKETDGWKVAQPSDTMLRGKWWEIFNDPELNALEEQLNVDNQNIKQSFANFMQARALVREARSQYFPTAATTPSFSRSRSSGTLGSSRSGVTGSTGSVTNTGQTSSIASLPLDISWAPDFWGKVRKTVHEFQYSAQLSAADLENQRLTEQASLATFFFEIRGQDALQKVLNDTVEVYKKTLELNKALYETGIGDQISVVQAQTALESAQAAAINLGIARSQFEHAIAVLIGKPAPAFSVPVKPMTTAAPPVPIGVPSQLLERRPDIAASERNMAAANAQIGIAYVASIHR
jgi:NodT family efflux transporter outer membrane factor (OMF) lipoprotein